MDVEADQAAGPPGRWVSNEAQGQGVAPGEFGGLRVVVVVVPLKVQQPMEVGQQAVVFLGAAAGQVVLQAVVGLGAVEARGEVEWTAARPPYNGGRPCAALLSTSACAWT